MFDKKLIAIGAGLFGFGAMLGWAITGDYHDRKAAKERAVWERLLKDKTSHIFALKDEIRELKPVEAPGTDFFPDEDIVEEDEEVAEEKAPEGVVIETVQEADEVYIPALDEDPEVTRSNLQKIIDDYTAAGQAAPEPDVYVDPEEISFPRNNKPPYVISQAEYAFGEEGQAFSKVTLQYFPPQRLLLDEDGDPIDDVGSTVGWKNLSQFGYESGDPDIVHVRNIRLLTDFEIVRDLENGPPLHVRFGMSRDEYDANTAAGFIKFRPEDL